MTTTVALLFGGRGGEHGISCVTAGGFLSAIDRDAYDVVAVGITREGRYVLASTDPEDWKLRDGRAPEVPADGVEVLAPAAVHRPGTRGLLRTVRDGRVEPLAEIDVVAPGLLHGPYGEDGTVQGLLDLLDIPYVGSGVLASATCMDKTATKAALETAGIRTAKGLTIREDAWAADPEGVARRVQDAVTPPWFVKPARAGSSLGVSRVTDPSQLEQALKTAFAEDPRILVEQAVVGREVECGVLDARPGGAVRTTVPGEVVVGDDLDFYDYESKYFGKGTVEIQVPARYARAGDRRGARGRGPRLPRAGPRRSGPGRRVRDRGRRGDRQRGQHDARLHPVLDVPRPVGVDGARLPRPHRRAHRAGAGAAHRPALTGTPGLPPASHRRRCRIRVGAVAGAAGSWAPSDHGRCRARGARVRVCRVRRTQPIG